MLKESNYFVVQAFMVLDLGLKGIERDIYAIIYGFSQTTGNKFTGSISYLEKWTLSSRPTIISALKKLVEKELLIKRVKYENGIKLVSYEINENKIGNKSNIEEKSHTEPNKGQLEQNKPVYKNWKKNNNETASFNPMKLYVREENPYGDAWKEPSEEDKVKIRNIIDSVKNNATWLKSGANS